MTTADGRVGGLRAALGGAAPGAVPGQLAPSDVRAARRLLPRFGGTAPLDRLAELASRLLRCAYAQVSLLTDVQTVVGAAGQPEVVGTESRLEDSLCTVTAQLRVPLVVPDAPEDTRVATLPPVTSGVVGSYLGVPLVTADGSVLGSLCAFDADPRDWSDGDVEVLEQLAASVVAELELSALAQEYDASRTRWELSMEAAGVGGFDWDLTTDRMSWDDRLNTLFGYDAPDLDQTIEAFYVRLHPEDLPRVQQLLQDAMAQGGSYEAEYRVVRPDGETRWVQARGRVLSDRAGRPVRLLGAAYDTTEVREGEARIQRVLESMNVGFGQLDRQWRVRYVNSEAERVLGMRRDQLLGNVLWDQFPALVGTAAEASYRAAMEHGEQLTFDVYYPEPLHAWYEVRLWPGPDGLSLYFLDITDRRNAQQAAERAAERAALLAQIASGLAATLETDEAVGRLARLVVPVLADWCVVTLVDRGVDAEPRLRDIASWHADPAQRETVEAYVRLRLSALADRSLLLRPASSGRPLVVQEEATERVVAALDSEEARDLLRRLAPETAAVLPLVANGRTLGLLTLCLGRERAGTLDLDTALDVASRAGLALDNARLYAQQRQLAEELQRSLLTAPPQPDHMDIVVRYEPAAEAAQVGGDWYDAFMQPSGETVVVIGDVVGHDTAAAAAMGQVRGLLRGITAATGDGPAAALQRLDATMELLEVGTTATAVVARFEQTDEERAQGLTRVRWSNAGHPPPLVLLPAGEVVVLGEPSGEDADLLLGIDGSLPRSEAVTALPRGSTVLFYTDGLIERRGQSLDEGLDLLCRTLIELGSTRPLEQLCDEVLRRLLPAHAEDDVAIAAVRLHREDRPRPREAGPQRVPPAVERE